MKLGEGPRRRIWTPIPAAAVHAYDALTDRILFAAFCPVPAQPQDFERGQPIDRTGLKHTPKCRHCGEGPGAPPTCSAQAPRPIDWDYASPDAQRRWLILHDRHHHSWRCSVCGNHAARNGLARPLCPEPH